MSNIDNVNFEEMMNGKNSPFSKKEKTKMIRIKESVYNELKKRAYDNDTKMNHELDKLVSEAFKYEKEHDLN